MLALNHVGISVRDLDAAHAFWSRALGALDHGGFAWPVGTAPADESLALNGTSARVALLRTDTAFVELFEFATPTPADRPVDAPGGRALVWAVSDVVAAEEAALAHGGAREASGLVRCPDGVPVRLVPASPARGLVGVEVLVDSGRDHLLAGVPGPVDVVLAPGAGSARPSPVDRGLNHLCLDVDGIDGIRAAARSVRWHHPVTESSGGAAAVCYGTTDDGVLVELLESRSDAAFFARCHLAHG